METSKALVILSGGQDSATCLYWARNRFQEIHSLTFDYGQRHRTEIDCAERLADRVKSQHFLLKVSSLQALGNSALVNESIKVQERGGFQNLPSTFVPGRNALFLTLAAAFAAPRGISDLIIGACETDYSGYPDCREVFLQSMEQSLSLAMDFTFRIHRPLMQLTKAQTFRLAEELGALDEVIENSHTCYEGDRKHKHAWGYGCGECPACQLRRRGFEEFLKEKSDGKG